MFEAKGILLDEIKAMDEMKDATAAGRGYGVAGGVANAIKECIEKYYPGTPVNIQHAESLAECKKALLLAKAGKMNGCLIEGMACPGGCIAGAGTNIAIPVAARAVDKFKNEAEKKVPDESVDQEMVELEKNKHCNRTDISRKRNRHITVAVLLRDRDKIRETIQNSYKWHIVISGKIL